MAEYTRQMRFLRFSSSSLPSNLYQTKIAGELNYASSPVTYKPDSRDFFDLSDEKDGFLPVIFEIKIKDVPDEIEFFVPGDWLIEGEKVNNLDEYLQTYNPATGLFGADFLESLDWVDDVDGYVYRVNSFSFDADTLYVLLLRSPRLHSAEPLFGDGVGGVTNRYKKLFNQPIVNVTSKLFSL